MNPKELKRFDILSRVQRGEMTLKAAATVLGLEYRQVRRIYKRFRLEGEAGLIHKTKGKPSGRASSAILKDQIIARYRELYSDFGPTLAAEKLAESGYLVDHDTLRRKLHRHRRKSREHFGELVQMDGSYHAWFEEREGWFTLMSMVDDATNTTLAILSEMETTESALQLLWKWIESYGIPQSLYTDRHSVYYGITGQQEKTQFGRACQELGIRIIYARSPQAKGRVEKWNAIYQDRLVKELRLQGMNSLSQANLLMAGGFVDKLNDKFSGEPASPIDFHSSVNPGLNLLHILSVRDRRKISNDWVIHWRNRLFQILVQPLLPKAGSHVEVRLYLDNSIHIFASGRELKIREIVSRMTQSREGKPFQQLKEDNFKQMKKLREEGQHITSIASKVQMAETTVRKYLKNGEVPEPQKRGKRRQKAADYNVFILKWLQEKAYEGTEIHEKLLVLGYKGSLRTVQRVIREIKANEVTPEF